MSTADSVLSGADRWTIMHREVPAALSCLPDASIDSVVCDPPYDLTAVSRNGSARNNDPETPFGRTRLGGDRGFMGKTWDGTGVAFRPETWAEVLRVLKPGGHLLAFGGTRTSHRMACAIEDAGFEIRDSIDWLYGSGFPKSLNISKALDSAGGVSTEAESRRLRSRRETAGLSREQVADAIGCTAASVRDWEEGRARAAGGPVERIVPSPQYRDKLDALLGYPQDAREVVGETTDRRGDGTVGAIGHSGVVRSGGNTDSAIEWDGYGTALKPAHEPIVLARKPLDGTVADNVLRHGTAGLNIAGCRHYEPGSDIGRWPPNVLLTHSLDCLYTAKTRWACVAGCPVAEMDRQSGESESRIGLPRASQKPGDGWGITATGQEYEDAGGASRFFPTFAWDLELDAPFMYCAKPSRAERDAGCDDLPPRSGAEATDSAEDSARLNSPRTGAGRTGGARNVHPTVKPVELMRWLCRLVTPPGGVILDPFTGSGTTGMAAMIEGFRFIGCEMTAEYLPIATARIAHAIGIKPKPAVKVRFQRRERDDRQTTMLGGAA